MKYILAIIALFVFSGCPKKSVCEHGTLENQVECLKNLPREHVHGFAEIKEQHGIYYSITTSPDRLRNLHHVLNTLDFSIPEKVFIVLPVQYKNKEFYDPAQIEKIELYSDKIKVLRPEHDLGPIMKLIPAVEEVRKIPGDFAHSMVLTFDDDTGYPAGLPEQLIKYSTQLGTVVAGSAHDATFWGIGNFPGSKHVCEKSPISECDVVEGFHGVAYPVHLVDTEKMKTFTAKPGCKLADDFVISYVLMMRGVKRILVRNQYTDNLHQFEYGKGPDAAFRIHANDEKYRECFASMNGH